MDTRTSVDPSKVIGLYEPANNVLGSLGTKASMDPSEVVGQMGQLRPGESLLGHWARRPAWTHLQIDNTV